MLSINISELIWTVICFFILYFLLKKLLYTPLVSFMDKREEKISSGLEKLENIDRAIARSNEAAEARLSESRSRGDRLIAEARADFESRHEELIKRTGDESRRTIDSIGERLEPVRKKTEQELSASEGEYAELLLERLLKQTK